VADRRVRQSGKNDEGDITSLCNTGEWWSPRAKRDAISDIENGTHRYFVHEVEPPVWVRVIQTSTGKHLRTDADRTSRNNLRAASEIR
jgi:hypothetical protein